MPEADCPPWPAQLETYDQITLSSYFQLDLLQYPIHPHSALNDLGKWKQ